MKQMLSRSLLAMALIVSLLSISVIPVIAGASTEPFSGSLTYQNPTDTDATGQVTFYAQDNGAAVATVNITVPKHGAGSFSFGGVTALGSTFAGSAVLSADAFLATTVVEYSSNPAVDRAVYTGASVDDVSTTMYVPLVSQNKFDQLTTVSVQNADGVPVNVVVKYINRDTGAVALTVPINSLPVGSAHYLKSDTVGLPAGFTGSAVITATGKIYATANNPYISENKIVAFEGLGVGAQSVYLPSAQCNYASALQTTYFAIQNTDLSASTYVTVTYYNTSGTQVAQTKNQQISGGRKYNTDPCSAGLANGFLGSAIVTATGPGIVALVNTGAANSTNFATAYDGIGAGFEKGAISYIRYGGDPTDWITFVACQNVGGGATTATIKYYDFAGTQKGTTQTFSNVQPGIKFNTNASAAGALDGTGKFKGGIEIAASTGGKLGCVVQAVSVDGVNAAAFNAVRVP